MVTLVHATGTLIFKSFMPLLTLFSVPFAACVVIAFVFIAVVVDSDAVDVILADDSSCALGVFERLFLFFFFFFPVLGNTYSSPSSSSK